MVFSFNRPPSAFFTPYKYREESIKKYENKIIMLPAGWLSTRNQKFDCCSLAHSSLIAFASVCWHCFSEDSPTNAIMCWAGRFVVTLHISFLFSWLWWQLRQVLYEVKLIEITVNIGQVNAMATPTHIRISTHFL